MQSSTGQLKRALRLSVFLCCAALAAQAEPVLQMTANLIWKRDETWFGGFSGIEVGENGATMTLLTDRRNLILGKMIRDGTRLKGFKIDRRVPIRHANRKLVKNSFADSEGLAIARDGTVFLSFETATRVVQISLATGVTTRLPDHADFFQMRRNKGLEALAVHPNGTVYTLPEWVPAHRTTTPLYAFTQNTWRRSHMIPRSGPFLPVGADFDRMGRLYLLERALTPLGFRSRIRRFDLDKPDLGAQTLLSTGPGKFDNMEALSVWEDQNGTTHLTLISDDNFRSIQRTQIVEYRLTE